MMIKCFPLKKRTNEAAGYTTRLVPATIRVSHELIASIAWLIVLSSKPSSYNTTSGLIIPPHEQCGTDVKSSSFKL